MISIQMFFLAVLLAMNSAKSAKIHSNTKAILCNGVIFDGTYYDKELIFRGSGRCFNLLMHNASGELYFSHAVNVNETTKYFIPEIKACYVHNKTCRDIKGIVHGFAIGYDQPNDNIYFGGIGSGLYIYDKNTRSANYFGQFGSIIWHIFIYNTLYYVEYPSQHLYVYTKGKFVRIDRMPYVLCFLTNSKAFYFANLTGLYFIDRNELNVTYLLKKHINITQMAEDINGKVYFCANDGIYTEDNPFHKVKKIANIPQAFGLAFNYFTSSNIESFEIIYSSSNNIYKLLPSKYDHICLTAQFHPNRLSRKKPNAVYLNLKLDFR